MDTNERKKPHLDLNTRAVILRRLGAGENLNLLADEYGVSRSTIWSIKKNEENILKKEKDPNSVLGALDKRLLRWVKSKREKGFAVTGIHIKKMGQVINDRLGEEGKPDFNASNGWLYRFLNRTGIKLKDTPDDDTFEANASTAATDKEKRKRTLLGNEDKLVILKRLQAGGVTMAQLAAEYDVGQSTISNIKKRAEEGFDFKIDHLENKLAEWITRKQEEGFKLTGTNIREMAIAINERLGDDARPDFTASNRWFYRFLSRHRIKLKEMSGKALSESIPMEIEKNVEMETVELQDGDSGDLIEEDPISSCPKRGDKPLQVSSCDLQPMKNPASTSNENGLGARANLSNKDRLTISARVQAGEKSIDMPTEYGVSPSIISNIKKRSQEGHHFKGYPHLLESQLVQWITSKQEENIKLTGINIREMAVEINEKLGEKGVPTFTGSNGWLYRFLNRTGIKLKDSVKYAIDGSSSCTKDTPTRSHLSSQDKLAILKKLEAGRTSLAQLAERYGVTTNTISNIRKRSQEDYKMKIKKTICLDKRLARWIHSKQRKGLTLSNNNIRKMALVINDRLGDKGIPDFVASKRWLYTFFDRNNITFKERSGNYAPPPKEIDSDPESRHEKDEPSSETSPEQPKKIKVKLLNEDPLKPKPSNCYKLKAQKVMNMRDLLEIRKRIHLDRRLKLEVLGRLDAGETCVQLAEEYGVSQALISDIKKRSVQAMTGGVRGGFLDKPVLRWIEKREAAGTKMSGLLIRKAALVINRRIGEEGLQDFRASNGWLSRFMQRTGFKLKGRVLAQEDSMNKEIPSDTEEVADIIQKEDYDDDELQEEIERVLI